ncbi:hypothetical protein, partial [Serratia marcescens]|uniref:hypothetical protein n=1 Tax=Serratia marcescens TaxID=615 RepID=UPI002380A078
RARYSAHITAAFAQLCTAYRERLPRLQAIVLRLMATPTRAPRWHYADKRGKIQRDAAKN